jgi:ubiquinone/menaquinone biosynthesis C-methylase UbiE
MDAKDASRNSSSQPWRQETEAWSHAYGGEAEVERRRAAMPRKLEMLGLHRAARSIRILDLCCGNGEALDALYQMGFRDLHGADISIPPRLAGDSRFQAEVCSAADPPFPDATFDWIVIIHAMHHLGTAPEIKLVLDQAYRVLKPGGRLSVIDFPNSPQIRLAFWWFRQGWFLWTPYLKYFGRIIQEEWSFLQFYLPQFGKVRELLLQGRFEVESKRSSLFYFFWTLRKPA